MSPPQIVFTPSPTITAESGHYTPHLLAWTGSGKEEGVKGVENSGMLNGTPSGYTTNEVTLSTTSLINSPLALTSTLHKKGSTSRSWLPRLCVLKSSYIFYFPSEKLTTPASGCVPLFGCILTLPENGMRVFKYHKSTSARSGFEFCVTTQIGVNKNRKFFFTAETEGNRREWVEGIKGGREEYGSECHLKVESLSKVDSVEGYFRQNPSSTASAYIRGLEGELGETDEGVKRNCMDFYPDLVEASKVIMGFGKELGQLDERFNAVYSSVEKIGRWEADWSDDDSSTSSSSSEDESETLDNTLIKDYVDNLDFTSALTALETREKTSGETDPDSRKYIETHITPHLEPFHPSIFLLYSKVDRLKAVKFFNDVQRRKLADAVKGISCKDIVKGDHVIYARWTVIKFFKIITSITTDWELYFPRDLLWVKFIMESFESLANAIYGPKALGGVNLDMGEEKEVLFEKVAEVVDLVGDKCQDFESTWGMPVVGIMKWEGGGREAVKSKISRWKDLI